MWRPSKTNLLAFAVFGAPMLLALNLPPSPTLLNQCIAVGMQGAWLAMQGRQETRGDGGAGALLAALALSGVAALGSVAVGLPITIAWGAISVLGSAALVVAAAHATSRPADIVVALRALAFALLAAGSVSALIGCVQVFAPDLADGDLVARLSLPGRAAGNLRQPNHLASLLLWALIGGVLLAELRVLGRPATTAVSVLLVVGLVLTGSRTGVLGAVVLAAWGLCDRRLSRSSRASLIAVPLLMVVLWLGLSAWTHTTGQAFAADRRSVAGSGDISSSRFAIWSNALSMIAREPWTGVGYGEFNLAWTLTAFPDRPTAFFDHTHNLPLQLLVELGIPLGFLVVVLLVTALVQAWRRAWAGTGNDGLARRAAFMIVLTMGLHSMLEYPLWYAYFLLPTAYAWGFALRRPLPSGTESGHRVEDGTQVVQDASRRNCRTQSLVGVAIAIGAAAAALDYRSVVAIYDPPADAAPLEDRIARGQRSLLFGHHADYAAATAFGPPKAPLSPMQELAFRRAPHQLLDVRLMIAWSQALAAQGDLDKARWLAARIREFRNPGADEYFAPCQHPTQAAQAFQCQPPTRVVHWREFVQR